MRIATSIHRIGNGRGSSSTLVGSKEYLPFATFLLAATGTFLTPSYFLYGKIDSSIEEINGKIDSSIKEINGKIDSSIKEIKDDNALFRSEITKLHSDISKNLMVHNGEIATLKERSNMKPPI